MHRVNWTYMVDNGWDLLQDYDSELEDSSSDDAENDLGAVALAVAAKAESKSSGSRRRRYKVALKSVLEALAEDTSDEEVKKKLKKKEHKAAREEEERQRRAKTQGKLNSRPTPMETELPASDVLKILPRLTKQEKKDLYKKLKKEQEEEAASYLDPHLNAEKLKRVERRTSGYSAVGPGRRQHLLPVPAARRGVPRMLRSRRRVNLQLRLHLENCQSRCERNAWRSSGGDSTRTAWTARVEQGPARHLVSQHQSKNSAGMTGLTSVGVPTGQRIGPIVGLAA